MSASSHAFASSSYASLSWTGCDCSKRTASVVIALPLPAIHVLHDRCSAPRRATRRVLLESVFPRNHIPAPQPAHNHQEQSA